MSSASAGRYHLVLIIDGTDVLHGWWDNPDIAESKFTDYKEEHSERLTAQLRLTEADGAGVEWELRQWSASSAS
ncbi:hypothetical protein ABZT51_39220 [Streptomyces sp. NPDC005373]